MPTTITLVSNVVFLAAPPSYTLPNSNGFAFPTGFTVLEVNLDTTNMRPADSLTYEIQFQYDSGDGQGASAWHDLQGSIIFPGPYTLKNGTTTNTYSIFVSIPQGTRYPSNIRMRVDQNTEPITMSLSATLS